MATTKIWAIKDSLSRVLAYAENPEKTANPDYDNPRALYDVLHYTNNSRKTEQQFYTSGVNCLAETAYRQMTLTKKQFGKEGGNVAFHAYQSFASGEVTADLAHEVGLQLAKRVFGDRFEVLVSTHLNTNCFHNHLVINSVSFVDGKRYNDCKRTYCELREASDAICLEYRLSVIDNPAQTKTPRNIYMAEKSGLPTLYNVMREDIDDALLRSATLKQFALALRHKGYALKFDDNRKYWTIQAPGQEKCTRLKTLGENYTEDAIKRRILQQRIPVKPLYPPQKQRTVYYLHGNLFGTRKITGFRARYLYYCYKLGVLPKGNNNAVHAAVRPDLQHKEIIVQQAVLLLRNQVDTPEQLDAFIQKEERHLAALCKERAGIYNKLRRCTDETQVYSLKTKRNVVSGEIAALRSQKKLAQSIREKESEVRTKLAFVSTVNDTKKMKMRQLER